MISGSSMGEQPDSSNNARLMANEVWRRKLGAEYPFPMAFPNGNLIRGRDGLYSRLAAGKAFAIKSENKFVLGCQNGLILLAEKRIGSDRRHDLVRRGDI